MCDSRQCQFEIPLVVIFSRLGSRDPISWMQPWLNRRRVVMSNVSHIGMIYISVDGVFILSIVLAVSIVVTFFFIFTLVDDFYLREIV